MEQEDKEITRLGETYNTQYLSSADNYTAYLGANLAKYASLLVGISSLLDKDFMQAVWAGMGYAASEGIIKMIKEGTEAKRFSLLEKKLSEKQSKQTQETQ